MKTENKRIEEWNEERGLIKKPKEFDISNEFSFILEEVIEAMTNLKSEEAREFAVNLSNVIFNGNIKQLNDVILERKLYFINDSSDIYDVNSEQVIDALCDIKVFASGAIRKLGYDADIAMGETLKEIESRVGKQINGKFVKDKSPEAQAKWYKADYSKAKV